ncbi:hypothetical protein ALC62_01107 [Cyphomyrmex costatus]|uniref:Uncharacterized protein n=1 Tax=Cyphomyrmex costatus TaxID=456900 RepID=A0A195D4U6_9HYME|nr:hypothetical protein ALC62_01107 [Cyphomyrmex costatus]
MANCRNLRKSLYFIIKKRKRKRVNEVYVNNESEEMNTSECCSTSANGGCNARWRDHPKIIPSSIMLAETVECPTGCPIIVKPPSTFRASDFKRVRSAPVRESKKKVGESSRNVELVLQYAVKLEHVGGMREGLLDFSIFFHSSILTRPFLPSLYCFFPRSPPEAWMEKEKEEAEGRGLERRRKVLERRGNIVLNRKIGILINTRGLSIKGREKRVREGMRKEEGQIARNDDPFRSFHPSRIFDTHLNVFSNSPQGRTFVGIDYIVMKILTFDVLQLMTPFLSIH